MRRLGGDSTKDDQAEFHVPGTCPAPTNVLGLIFSCSILLFLKNRLTYRGYAVRTEV
jgi:hypothetical protein